MTPIPLEIKEKHVCYCGHKIKTEAAGKYQPITRQVSLAMTGTEYNPERIISIEIEPEMIIDFMNDLGILHEKNTGSLHLAIKAQLKDSIAAKYTEEMAKSEEERNVNVLESIGWISQKIAEQEVEIDVWRNERIAEGRDFFIS